MPRHKPLNVVVAQAIGALRRAAADGRLDPVECAYRIGLVEGWLRARGAVRPEQPPLVDVTRLVPTPHPGPRPPFVARLPG